MLEGQAQGIVGDELYTVSTYCDQDSGVYLGATWKDGDDIVLSHSIADIVVVDSTDVNPLGWKRHYGRVNDGKEYLRARRYRHKPEAH